MPGSSAALPLLFAQAPAGGRRRATAEPAASSSCRCSWRSRLFYFIIFRPQQQQEKKRQGDDRPDQEERRVMTAAGMYGTVMSVDARATGHAPARGRRRVKVEFSKASIVRVSRPAEKPSKGKSRTGFGRRFRKDS